VGTGSASGQQQSTSTTSGGLGMLASNPAYMLPIQVQLPSQYHWEKLNEFSERLERVQRQVEDIDQFLAGADQNMLLSSPKDILACQHEALIALSGKVATLSALCEEMKDRYRAFRGFPTSAQRNGNAASSAAATTAANAALAANMIGGMNTTAITTAAAAAAAAGTLLMPGSGNPMMNGANLNGIPPTAFASPGALLPGTAGNMLGANLLLPTQTPPSASTGATGLGALAFGIDGVQADPFEDKKQTGYGGLNGVNVFPTNPSSTLLPGSHLGTAPSGHTGSTTTGTGNTLGTAGLFAPSAPPASTLTGTQSSLGSWLNTGTTGTDSAANFSWGGLG